MEDQPQQPKKKRWIWLWVLVLLLTGFFGLFFLKTGFTVSQIISWKQSAQILPFAEGLPEKDPDRINILLLGMRGLEDPGEGKLLTDVIILLSLKKSKGQVALISIPRDLYVKIACLPEKKKINFAYLEGGLECVKATVSQATDLYIDYAVINNFQAFAKAIDALGEITIYLEQPFEEQMQWQKEGWEEDKHWLKKEVDGKEVWAFYLPKGVNVLDGQSALYYVRSRFSTSDFDRMRRQQQVLMAIKDKALSLGVLTNPIKIYNLLDILGKNIRTDMTLAEIKELINLALHLDAQNIKRRFFDISPDGLLYHIQINGEYILLPVGDNFEQIQEACQTIFD